MTTDFQTLQRDTWSQAQWFKVAIALSLTLATPYILEIVLSTFWAYHPTHARVSPDHDATRRHVTPGMVGTARGGREALAYFISGAFGKESSWGNRHRAFWFFAISSVFFVFYAQIIVGLVLTDVVVTSTSGLLKSEICGLYEYDNERGGEEDASRADMLMVGRERRASAYAQDCYGPDSERSGYTMKCSFFYNSTIGYQTLPDKCPFRQTEVCAEGYQSGSAITFDTGLVDSSILGINYKSTHRFRRTTTCAPLSAERPYVQHFSNRGSNESGYKYFYGSLYDTRNCSQGAHTIPPVLTDYTMRLVGHPFTWQAPIYKVE